MNRTISGVQPPGQDQSLSLLRYSHHGLELPTCPTWRMSPRLQGQSREPCGPGGPFRFTGSEALKAEAFRPCPAAVGSSSCGWQVSSRGCCNLGKEGLVFILFKQAHKPVIPRRKWKLESDLFWRVGYRIRILH